MEIQETETQPLSQHSTAEEASAEASALHHTYTLFSQLYLNGFTERSLAWIAELPELVEALQIDTLSPHQAAALHQELLGLNIFPYESIFLDTTGMFGGPITDAVRHAYQGLGYQPHPASTSPDHFGEALGLLAFLTGAEADAWEDGLSATAYRLRDAQRDFMETHLLRWLFPFQQAIVAQDMPSYTALCELTTELIHTHYQTLITSSKGLPAPWTLPDFPLLLEDERTGLKEIADYLVIPAYSGIFLSRHDLGQLGRGQRLPKGFGNRSLMLVNLLRSAVQYEILPQLVNDLQQLYQLRADHYQHQMSIMPEFTLFIQPWVERARETCRLFDQVQIHMLADRED